MTFTAWRAKVVKRKTGTWHSDATVSLPSKFPEYRFEVTFSFLWSTQKDRFDILKPIVLQAVRKIIEKTLQGSAIFDSKLAHQDIDAEFSSRLPLHIQGAVVSRVQYEVNVHPDCRNSALVLEGVMQQRRIDNELRLLTRSRINFLKNEMLADPASAKLYLIVSSDGTVDRIPHGEDLKRLIEELAWWDTENRWIAIARLLQDYLSNITPSRASELLTAFAAAVEAVGDISTANRIRAGLLDVGNAQ